MVSVALFLVLASRPTLPDQWLGLYLKDKKVGYSQYRGQVGPDGLLRTNSVSVIDGKMLGFGLTVKQTTNCVFSGEDRKDSMEFVTETGGKVQKVVANFDRSSIQAYSEMDGRKTEKSLSRPSGQVYDDPVNWFYQTAYGTYMREHPFYVFDPNTLELVKCEPKVVGKESIETPLGKTEATVIDINDPRAPMKIYVSPKGDLIKATGPFGLEMRPVTEEVALAEGEPVDLAFASALKTDREIPDSTSLKRLRLKVTGADLSKLPSDAHQSVEKTDDGWTIEVHPLQPSEDLFGEVSTDPQWLERDVHIPSDKAKFKELSTKLTKGKATTLEKAEAVRQFVLGKVQANAGIGVLRDAEDILKTGEGVCRDHAILMATLLRASGIPTKLASGIVYFDGAFYYHAWVEIWTGKVWLAMDSTRPSRAVDATHVKIGQGTVGSAFTSFLLDGAKISILDP